LKCWYSLGTSWCHSFFSFLLALSIASWVDIVVFCTWNMGGLLLMSWVDAITHPCIFPSFQLMSGSVICRKGYPRMMLSFPRLVTKKGSSLHMPLCWIVRRIISVICPAALIVPSTFLAVWGLSNFCLRSLKHLTIQGEMQFSVAPLSINVQISACWSL
jgi:hypothetical protein